MPFLLYSNRFELTVHKASRSPSSSPKSTSSWPDNYLPDLPVPSEEEEGQNATAMYSDASQPDADNDTTLVISEDEQETSPVVPTLEVATDEADQTDDAESSSDSEIPTGYNSETGEVYQNQLADPIVAAKQAKQYL